MKKLFILLSFVVAVAFSNCTGFREGCSTYNNAYHARALRGKKVPGKAFDSNTHKSPAKKIHKNARKENMKAVRGDYCKGPKGNGFLGLF